jgi:hypothetical protein
VAHETWNETKVAAKKKREPTVFRIGRSALTGKIYVGYARGYMWVGNKKDVTDSFFQTVFDWLSASVEDGYGTLTIGNDESKYLITVDAKYLLPSAKKTSKRPRRKKR